MAQQVIPVIGTPPAVLSPAYSYVRDNSEMMTLVIIVLVLVIAYLYYQNKGLKEKLGSSSFAPVYWQGKRDDITNGNSHFEAYPGYDDDRKTLNNLSFIRKNGGVLTAEQQAEFERLYAKVNAAASDGTYSSINFDDYNPTGPQFSSACTLFNAQEAAAGPTGVVGAAEYKYDLSGANAIAQSTIAAKGSQVGGTSTLSDRDLAANLHYTKN